MASCRPKGSEFRCGRCCLAFSTANRRRRRLRGDAAAGHGRTGRGRRCRSMRWSTRWWGVRPRRQGRCRPSWVERSRRQPPICVHVPRLRSLLIPLGCIGETYGQDRYSVVGACQNWSYTAATLSYSRAECCSHAAALARSYSLLGSPGSMSSSSSCASSLQRCHLSRAARAESGSVIGSLPVVGWVLHGVFVRLYLPIQYPPATAPAMSAAQRGVRAVAVGLPVEDSEATGVHEPPAGGDRGNRVLPPIGD